MTKPKKSLNQKAESIINPVEQAEPEAAPQKEPVDFPSDEDDNDSELRYLKAMLPKGVNIQDAIDFGFYEYKNRYWMRRTSAAGDGFQPVSNFSMKVLYLIVGSDPKRIVQIRNVAGKETTIDFTIKDLISLDAFKERVESQGNFLFEGKITDLAKIKNKLYTLEKPSVEIGRLGQYRDKFWAFANGIYDGENFLPVDGKGMVTVGNDHYYIPVFGATKADDDEDLRNYRKFLHIEREVGFKEWAQQFVAVYGENGMVGIGFFIYALFSDIIFGATKAAPMLFLFGQRGSGKGTMANSLLTLFGFPQDPLMLGGASTVVGFMRKLGQFSNAITWLDEYKNDIGERKIESLKNIWDRVGYERGTKDSTNKTQTTPVTSSAIISGQEMPNVEPALFSRTVLCEFRSMQRSQAEVNQFNALRKIEELGITNVTLEVLTIRKQIKDGFTKAYSEVASALRAAMSDEDMIERQIINSAILCACIMVAEKHLQMPFTSSKFMQVLEKLMMRQRDMMKTSNEVQQFFEMVQFLLASGEIKDGSDIHIHEGLVKIRLVSVIPYYREYSRRQGLKPLDKGTLINYLTNSESYDERESKKTSHRFPLLHNPTSCVVFLQNQIQLLYGVNFNENTQPVDNQESK
jgi:hypothetical protein